MRPSTLRPALLPKRIVFAIAITLLGIFAALCLHTAHESSITFDEPEQVAVGYASWTQPGHGYSVINLRLSQLWQALPLLAFNPPPRFPSTAEQEAVAGQNISYGRLFFFNGGRDAQEMIFASRAMVVVLGILLGWVIFVCSRRLHGDFAGLLSLSLYAFCPLVIAHGSLATTEVATSLFFTLATLALWRLLNRPGVASASWAGLAVGALAATKISGLLIIPIIFLLIGVKVWERRYRDASTNAFSTPRWSAIFGALAGAALVAWATVWLVYGGPSAAPAPDAAPWKTHPTVEGHTAVALVRLARFWRLLPDAYLFDLHQFVHSGGIRRAYFFGEYSLDGWWYFFPVAWLVKNPLPLLAAVLAAALAAWRLRRATVSAGGVDWRGMTPLLVLTLVYGGFALAGSLNIGARHLLPIYPAALIFAGLAPRLFRSTKRSQATLVGALAGCAALETALAHPHHLGYFNVFAGGSNKGWHIMVDSSSDWGESLPAVRRWLDERNARASGGSTPPRPVFLSCFGNTDFAYYGLDEKSVVLLPQYYDNRPIRALTLQPGSYVVSATMLTCVYNGRFMGPWRPAYEKLYDERLHQMAQLQPFLRSKQDVDAIFARDGASVWMGRISDFDYLRFARLCAYLRQKEPDHHITPGMLVYEVTLQDLENALAGPPPELRPDGAIKGAERFADDDLDFIK